MHEAVIEFLKPWADLLLQERPDLRVLDIGGRKASTSGRYYNGPHPYDLFKGARQYAVIDLEPGPDVDIVADMTVPRVFHAPFDVVICTEVLEHVQQWPMILENCYRALRTGGRLLLTCAGPGRRPHPATTEDLDPPPGEWYQNVSHMDVRKVLEQVGFRDILTWQINQDTQATALR